LFTSYSLYICSSVAIAGLLPAVEEEHNWSQTTMVEIASWMPLGAPSVLLIDPPRRRPSERPTRQCGSELSGS